MKYKKQVAKIYALILTIGLILSGASMITWTLTPISNYLCALRWWLMGLGMIIFSGGVFCRSYQLKKIHKLVKSGRYQKSRNFDHIKLLTSSMGLITFIEVILLFILQLVSPFNSEIYVTDKANRLGEHHCQNEMMVLWVGIQSGYLVCILLLGVYSMYSTWKISSTVDDTRINILMIFICLVSLGVAGVIWGYSPSDAGKDDADAWWALSLITIWGICMVLSVFIPKFIKLRKSSSMNSSSTSTSKPVNTM